MGIRMASKTTRYPTAGCSLWRRAAKAVPVGLDNSVFSIGAQIIEAEEIQLGGKEKILLVLRQEGKGNLVYLATVTTSNDFTEFHVTIPSHKGEDAAEFLSATEQSGLGPVDAEIYITGENATAHKCTHGLCHDLEVIARQL